MKYIILLLVLAGCVQGGEKETASNPVENTESEAEFDPKTFVPKTEADLDKLRTPVPSYEVLNRLVRVKSTTSFKVHNLDGTLSGTARYSITYLDPVSTEYYFGVVDVTNYADNFANSLSYESIANHSLKSEDRLVAISNLSPSERVILDTGYFPQRTNLFIQVIRKTPDPYYCYSTDYNGLERREIRNINQQWLEQVSSSSLENNFSLTNTMIYIPYTNFSLGWANYYLVHTNINTPALDNRLHILRDLDIGDIRGFSWEFPID